jgi:hypothetical protein
VLCYALAREDYVRWQVYGVHLGRQVLDELVGVEALGLLGANNELLRLRGDLENDNSKGLASGKFLIRYR